VQHLLDLKLAGGLQIRAAAAGLGNNVPALVREKTHRLRSACIDA
jgi:hypothetical protein